MDCIRKLSGKEMKSNMVKVFNDGELFKTKTDCEELQTTQNFN